LRKIIRQKWSTFRGSQAVRITFSPESFNRQRKARTWKRGAVTGLSKEARKRLLEFLQQMDWADDGWFLITLTARPARVADWKVALHRWCSYVSTLGRAGILWRIEPHESGEAHFHLLLYVGVLDEDWKTRITSAWWRITRDWSRAHFERGVKIEPVRCRAAVMAYAAKYIAKANAVAGGCLGRSWGCYGRRHIPRHEQHLRLDGRAEVFVLRALRKLTGFPFTRVPRRQFAVDRRTLARLVIYARKRVRDEVPF